MSFPPARPTTRIEAPGCRTRERIAFSNRTTLVVISLALLVGACSAPSSLTVQLQSDLAPGVEVDHVEVVLTDASGESVVTRELELTSGRSLARPIRIAEVVALAAGTYDVLVTLSLHGVPLQSRPARTRVSGPTFVTLLMLRDCIGVTCPGAGDATATACLGGSCVPPECSEETPELCGPPMCTDDAECAPGAVACTTGRCSGSGICFAAPDDDACEGALVCDTALGCVAAACTAPEPPPYVRDCADAVARDGDEDGDGLGDLTDPNPSVCNALVAIFDRTGLPDAPWSDPTRTTCSWQDGDETSAIGAALGLTGLGAIVRARLTIDSVTEGGGAAVTMGIGGSTVVCEAGQLGLGQFGVGFTSHPLSVAPLSFPIVGVPIFVQAARLEARLGSVDCQVANADQSEVSGAGGPGGLDVTSPPSPGLMVRGATVTLDYVAVLAPAS